jgi:hypothetical protein
MGASGRRCHCAVFGAGCQLRFEERGPEHFFSSSPSVHFCRYITSTSKSKHAAYQSNVMSQHESVEVAPRKQKLEPEAVAPLHTKPGQTTSPRRARSYQAHNRLAAGLLTKHVSPLAAHHRSQSTHRKHIAANRHLALESPFLFLIATVPTTVRCATKDRN